MKILVFDVEANGLLPDATVVHCIATRDLRSREENFYGPDQIHAGLSALSAADVVVAHNGFGYDYPLLSRLHGWSHHAGEDSLILSRLYNPDRKGGHSVAAWAARLGGEQKVEHEDWSTYSEAMGERCRSDVRLQCKIVNALEAEGQGHDWTRAIRIEYATQELQTRIEQRGFRLDIPAAERLADEIERELASTDAMLNAILPAQLTVGSTVTKPFKLNGDTTAIVDKWLDGVAADVNGPFTKVTFEPLNLGSSKQVTDFLLSQGWEPDDWNYQRQKGRGGFELNPDGTYKISSPKLTESSLEGFDHPAGQAILKRRVLTHRLGVLRRVNKSTGKPGGWLNDVRSDGRVEGRAIPLGTNTGRYTHSGIVNVPAVGTLYGDRLRACLIASDGMYISGTDASGLEARIAGHYAAEYDGGEYGRELLEGDVHSKNAAAYSEAVGREIKRGPSKNITYGILFGAAQRKVASMIRGSLADGQALIDAFWGNNPGISEANDWAQDHARAFGWVPGLDGRRVYIRSPHSALNALIQSAGAQIMKAAFVYVARPTDPWHPVLTMHDEMQLEVSLEDADDLHARWEGAGKFVTESLGLRIPIEFETKVGLNYRDTH